jgi:1-acyl-sn-glycerol-3-phosphate acyltransferase
MEDISLFFPNSTENKRINEAYQKIGAANKIIVTISKRQDQHIITSKDSLNSEIWDDLLTEAATRFVEILQENDSANHIKELLYEIDNKKVREVSDFIVQNLPYFLEEEDYARMDSLLLPKHIENKLKADKELLLSPMGGFVRDVILNDPLHFSEHTLKKLENFKQNDNYGTDNGFIFNSKGECVVIITSKYPVSETANNKLLANEIYDAVNKTISEFDNEIKIVPFGAMLISLTNAEQIKNDSLFAVFIALILILALLFYFFRNIKSLFLIALSILFGALFSLGVIVLFKNTISVIAIGIASIIFGIAINYPLHFLAHYRHNSNVRQTIKEIVNPLIIGNITTVGAFLSLLFISSSAMHDLGLFSAFLLVGTIGFVLVFLPHFLGSNVKPNKFSESVRFGRLAEFSPEKNKYIVFVFLVFTVILFFFSFGAKFETNLHAINYMTDEQRIEINKLIEENKGKGKTIYVVAEGKTTDEALQNYEKNIWPVLNRHVDFLQNDGTFNTVSGISNFFPSKELQKQKIKRWNRFWDWNDGTKHEGSKKDSLFEHFNQSAKKQGFNENVFSNFADIINNHYEVQEFDYFAPIYQNLGENYFSIDSAKTFIYTTLQNPDTLISSNFSTSDTVFTFNDASIAQKMVNALSDDFNNVLYICGFIVFVFLFLSFGRIELAILTFLPLTFGWIWILGLMNIFDLRFNIVNIILATFIFGQGDDYTIFVMEGLIYEYTYCKKMLASFKNSIILSATILFIAIGMLIFAYHPALRSLAELTIVGMISVVACAYLFPPLVFRFLTVKRGKLREVPWTLKRFIMTAYAFAGFLAGSLSLTIYGFILLGFRKKPNESRKLRYHKLLQRTANFVIRRLPGVKFRYENLSGEPFDKPAIIISNHQSHFDLMCLMMLTPRLIILTNDWVWHSPFYGKIIRYADFYPVSNGIENNIERLAGAVKRNYSIVVFPEGTRSADCSIGRFHRGAFYLAEKLNLDIVPVFLHGAGHVLPKNDFLLREGQITVQVRDRITPKDERFATDYVTRSKQIRQYYDDIFAKILETVETPEYFRSFVMHNYIYKGVGIWRGAKVEVKEIKEVQKEGENSVFIFNSGYGVYAFMYALANKNTDVITIEEDEDKATVAKACAGLPQNLKIYSASEWKNT